MNRLSMLFAVLLVGLAAVSAPARAVSPELDAYVQEAVTKFYAHTQAGKALAARAKGMLVFPRVYKAGFVVGGEYGEGALLVNGKTDGYYSTASASLGFQIGAQRKTVILLFMNQEALSQFRESDGWQAGVDGSVALANLGAGDKIDTQTAQQPIVAFVFSNEGLMFNLNLEGTKISPIAR